MFKNLAIGKYYPIKSIIHKLNPINKIICMLIFLITLFIINHIYFYLILAILVMLLIIVSNIPIKYFIYGISSFKFLILIIFIFNYIFTNNLLLSVSLVLRIKLIITYTLLFSYTTKPNEIIYGLEKVFLPLKYIKIPIEAMVLSLTLVLQFIPIIFEQVERILKAQSSRGFDLKYLKIKDKLIILSTIVVPMLILSFKRADSLADLMEVRLYNCNGKRSCYKLSNWSTIDNTVIILHIVVLMFLILSEVVII